MGLNYYWGLKLGLTVLLWSEHRLRPSALINGAVEVPTVQVDIIPIVTLETAV